MVLDGVDLIAKADPKVFVYLIDCAKYLANLKHLRIVLVSSEGNVMPLIGITSSKTRITSVCEIVDLPDKEVKEFLHVEMDEDIVEQVLAITGGRLIYMIQALSIYEKLLVNGQIEGKEVPTAIESRLMSRFVNKGMEEMMLQDTFRVKEAISKHLASQESTSLSVRNLCKQLPTEVVKAEIVKAVKHLIDINFLRYQAEEKVTFHSKLVERYVRKYLVDK